MDGRTEKDIEYIRQTLDKQSEILVRLSNAIQGDKEYGTKGLAEMCRINSEYIQNDKLFKAKITGIATGISLFVGVVTSIVMKALFEN